MAQAKCDLQKIVEDKDLQIVQLMNKLEPTNAGESSHNHSSSPKHDGQEKQAYEELPMQQSVKKSSYSATSIALLSVQQLLEMIANTIKAQYGESTQNSPAYSKPYSKRIDTLRMLISYRPPKLQQFDGKDNPKQHIAHFIKTCNNAGTDGDHLVKQFVQSLKGNAFDWYVDLEPESIDRCDKMEREFLNRFYNTRRTVSMIANAKACIGDSSTFCKRSSLENFEDLDTRAHDIQLIITNHKTVFLIDDQTKDKKDLKRREKYTKANVKESMTIKTTSVKISSNDRKRSQNPDEAERVSDPKYCKYHRVVSHPIEIFVVKEKIMVIAKEGKIILDIEEMAGTNVASITTANNSMQEILPSKISIDQSLEEVHPRATPIENNDEILSKATKNEALTNGKHEISKPPYSPVFQNVVRSNDKEKQNQLKDHSPLLFKGRKQLNEARVKDLREIKTKLVTPITSLHPLISSDSPIPENQHRNMQGAFSQKAYHLLAKIRYDFSAPSRLNKLNPELTGEKIHGLTKAQHKLRNQDFRVVQPRIGLGATYRRAVQNIFDNMLHKKVECYVDDLVDKIKKREEHLADLQIVFNHLRKYNLQMNPLKCAFGITSGKFLHFIVRHRAIKVDPAKVDAIQKMPPPRNLKELRRL
ncbi:UNVERIFIED_CONTAM: hypothetical protein Scaly_2636200 [Sesamum calycinum]|uniref:Reverse transcriptase domain-containing protein n=1 Tax=Sesamum calycinum TaxID=2727403 RepID=A0AAW2JBB7_9LAMI